MTDFSHLSIFQLKTERLKTILLFNELGSDFSTHPWEKHKKATRLFKQKLILEKEIDKRTYKMITLLYLQKLIPKLPNEIKRLILLKITS